MLYTIVYVTINIVAWAYVLGTITLLVTRQVSGVVLWGRKALIDQLVLGTVTLVFTRQVRRSVCGGRKWLVG